VPTPLGIAVQHGWIDAAFQPAGWEVRSLREDPSREIRESHYDHKLVNSFRQGGSVPAIWARSHGRDTRVVGLTWTDEFQAIVTRTGSGIRTALDLVGRRVGVPRRDGDVVDFPRAMALRGLDQALGTVGSDLDRIEIVDVARTEGFADRIRIQPTAAPAGASGRDQPEELGALLRGEVDAIYLKGARALGLVRDHGLTIAVDIGGHPDPLVRANNGTPRPLTVDGTLLREHPGVVTDILARVIAAGRWAEAHPDETAEYIAREVGSTPELVRAAYGPALHRGLGTGLDRESIHGFTDFTAWLHQHGFIPEPVDVAAWIDPEPLARLAGRTGLAG
jgi:2'-hydroxybiphenyl-2-sulfinate desulfinase